MLEVEWKEEGDLRPGQDPAWEEGLQHQNDESSGENDKRLTCRLPVGQAAALVQGLWTVQLRQQRGRARPPRRCLRRRWGDPRGGLARLHPADDNIILRFIGRGYREGLGNLLPGCEIQMCAFNKTLLGFDRLFCQP